MAYDDTASRRSHGGRSSRTHDSYGDDQDYRHGTRAEYYDQRPLPADNSALARRSELPAAYYDRRDHDRNRDRDRDYDRGYEPSTRSSGRSNRARSRSITPPPKSKATTRRGDILSAVGGALVATAADKYFIEPRMNKGHRRSKSHNEGLRRAADVGIGGAAGTAIYRAVSRSRVRKKDRGDSRPGSPDSRGRNESRGRGDSRDSSQDEKRSRSNGLPWKAIVTSVGVGIAGLAAEQFKKRGDSQRDSQRDGKSRSGRDHSDDEDYDSDRSKRSTRSKSRRHRSADDDRRSRRRDDSADSYDDYDRRDRRRRDDKSSRGAGGGGSNRSANPHQGRDLVEEAIGLLGVAQGLKGKNKGPAALEAAIGAAGLAHNAYSNYKAKHPPAAAAASHRY